MSTAINLASLQNQNTRLRTKSVMHDIIVYVDQTTIHIRSVALNWIIQCEEGAPTLISDPITQHFTTWSLYVAALGSITTFPSDLLSLVTQSEIRNSDFRSVIHIAFVRFDDYLFNYLRTDPAWRHIMGTLPALLAVCEGNPAAIGHQRILARYRAGF